MRYINCLCLLFLSTVLFPVSELEAQQCVPPSKAEAPSSGAQVPPNVADAYYRFKPNVPSAIRDELKEGTKRWNAAWCNVGGDDFPFFRFAGSSAAPGAPPVGTGLNGADSRYFNVSYRSGDGPKVNGLVACGQTSQGLVQLFEKDNNGNLCPAGRIANGLVPSGQGAAWDEFLTDIMSHEIGHWLGLGHHGASCTNAIMTASINTNTPKPNWGITGNECKKANEVNISKKELGGECTGDPSCFKTNGNNPLGPVLVPGFPINIPDAPQGPLGPQITVCTLTQVTVSVQDSLGGYISYTYWVCD